MIDLEALSNLSNAQHDGLVTCLVLAYALALTAACEKLVSKRWASSALSRKIVHCGAASWLIFWPLYRDVDGSSWSWRLNALIPAAKGVQLFVKGALVRNPNDRDVISMSRTGSPSELLLGPLQFTLVMTTVGLCLFRQPSACLVMGAVGIGDGIAPIVGGHYGRHKYRSPLVGQNGSSKSIEGSIAVFAGTIIGYYLYSFIASINPLYSGYKVVACALVAALVEGLAPSNIENLAIPSLVYFVCNYFMDPL